MAGDDPLIITPDEAVALLVEGESVHNFVNPSGILVGCDYERQRAIEHLRVADRIEIGGPSCKSMKHAIVAWSGKRLSFFESDMTKVEAFEAARGAS